MKKKHPDVFLGLLGKEIGRRNARAQAGLPCIGMLIASGMSACTRKWLTLIRPRFGAKKGVCRFKRLAHTQSHEQTACEENRAKERTAYEENRAKARTACEEKRAKVRTAYEEKRAKARTAFDENPALPLTKIARRRALPLTKIARRRELPLTKIARSCYCS